MKSKVLVSNEEYIIITGIVMAPFLFFLYDLYPRVYYWPVYFSQIHKLSFFYELDFELWYFGNRLLALVLASIWFLTCNRPWKYLILFLAYKQIWYSSVHVLIELFESNGLFTPNWMRFYIGPFICIVVYTIIILYLNKALGFKSHHKNGLYGAINQEIHDALSKVSKVETRTIKEKRKSYKLLQQQKQDLSEDDYLKELIRLRDS